MSFNSVSATCVKKFSSSTNFVDRYPPSASKQPIVTLPKTWRLTQNSAIGEAYPAAFIRVERTAPTTQ